MNQFVAVHTHEWGSTVYPFQSELTHGEILAKYSKLDQELELANDGTDLEMEDTDGSSIAKALGINFDFLEGETINVVELSSKEIPTL